MGEASTAWEALARLRAAPPLVHCITNYVAMDVTANVLLALGASPAMVHAREEVEDFATVASALVVNIGTLSPAWRGWRPPRAGPPGWGSRGCWTRWAPGPRRTAPPWHATWRGCDPP
jgi:hypothetical protein